MTCTRATALSHLRRRRGPLAAYRSRKIDRRLTVLLVKRLPYRVLAKEIAAVAAAGRRGSARGSRAGGGYHHPVARRARKLPRRRRRPRSVRYLDLFHAITAIRGRFNNRSLIVTPRPPAAPGSAVRNASPRSRRGRRSFRGSYPGRNGSGMVFRRFRVGLLRLAETDCSPCLRGVVPASFASP